MNYPVINKEVSKCWEELQLHFENNKNTSLKNLFLEDKFRESNLTYSISSFKLDLSRNHLNKKSLSLLIKLAEESKLSEKIKDLFTGKQLNIIEKRSVLHTALRDVTNNKIYAEEIEVKSLINENLKRIETFSKEVISGKHLGCTGKKITDVVNIGIGGSDLGPKMVVESLAFYKNHLTTHFLSNMDGDQVGELLQIIDPETTLFIVVSKTFTTQETLINAKFIKDWFIEKTNSNKLEQHFIGVSSNINAVLEFGINKENIFPMWNWVGGRFSLWSSVGLSIALSVGFNNFTQLLEGANEMDVHFRNTDFNKNLPVLSALTSIWYNNFYLTETQAILPYSHYLGSFIPYVQQLSMESNGKSVDVNGKEINYQTGNIVWGNVGTNMQHAFMQLLHQGTKIVPAEFIAIENGNHQNKNQHNKLIANLYGQANALCFGKTKDKAFLDLKLNNIENIAPLLPYKVFKGNRPSTILSIEQLTPSNLGKLIAFYEHKTFVQGIIWNINSFDQFGVELGKELTKNS